MKSVFEYFREMAHHLGNNEVLGGIITLIKIDSSNKSFDSVSNEIASGTASILGLTTTHEKELLNTNIFTDLRKHLTVH